MMLLFEDFVFPDYAYATNAFYMSPDVFLRKGTSTTVLEYLGKPSAQLYRYDSGDVDELDHQEKQYRD